MNLDADTWVKLHESCGLSITGECAQRLPSISPTSKDVPQAVLHAIHMNNAGALQHPAFVHLCGDVEQVDRDAAYWMRVWLPTWAKFNECLFRPEMGSLGKAFWWKGTPQGHDYWLSIGERLTQNPHKAAPSAETPPGPYYDELRAKRTARDLAISLKQEVRAMLHSGGWHDDS